MGVRSDTQYTHHRRFESLPHILYPVRNCVFASYLRTPRARGFVTSTQARRRVLYNERGILSQMPTQDASTSWEVHPLWYTTRLKDDNGYRQWTHVYRRCGMSLVSHPVRAQIRRSHERISFEVHEVFARSTHPSSPTAKGRRRIKRRSHGDMYRVQRQTCRQLACRIRKCPARFLRRPQAR